MDHRKISETLLEAFKISGKSYAELERATGIHKSMIQRYLTGSVERIPLERLEALCKELGLIVEDLIGWDRSRPAQMAEPGKVYRSMTPQQAVLFDASEGLTEPERQAVINMINAFKESRGE